MLHLEQVGELRPVILKQHIWRNQRRIQNPVKHLGLRFLVKVVLKSLERPVKIGVRNTFFSHFKLYKWYQITQSITNAYTGYTNFLLSYSAI